MAWTIFITFIYCECGERVSNGFSDMYDVICEFQWYLFSIEVQQMLPTILIIAQEPVTLHGFANTSCTRETFKKVGLLFKYESEAKLLKKKKFLQVVHLGFTIFRMVMFCRLQSLN